MRLAIISDVHANLEALRAVLNDVAAQAADRIVCLGDIVGYNASPAECVALLRDRGALCIAGNHDRAVTGQIDTEGFCDVAIRRVAWTRERLADDDLRFLGALPLQATVGRHLVAVHGALGPGGGCDRTYMVDDEQRHRSLDALAAHPSTARICCYGHTHHWGVHERRAAHLQAREGDEIALRPDAYYLINPGTVGQPRGTSDRRATYVVLDTARRVVTTRRVSYDFSRTVARNRKAGLAPWFTVVPAGIRAPLAWSLRKMRLYDVVRRAAGLDDWSGGGGAGPTAAA